MHRVGQIIIETRRSAPCSFQPACSSFSQSQCAGEPQAQTRIDGGDPVVGHDAPAAGKRFRLSRGKRLPDIEHAKKYKTQQQILPVKGPIEGDESEGKGRSPNLPCRGNREDASEKQRQVLTGDLIDDDALRVLEGPEFGRTIGRENSGDGDDCGEATLCEEKRVVPEAAW